MPELSVELLMWGAATALLATSAGFAAGLGYARWMRADRLPSSRELHGLCACVARALDAAEEVCALLERTPDRSLSSAQLEQFDRRRQALDKRVARLATAVRAGEPCPAGTRGGTGAIDVPPAGPIEWTRLPTDLVTGLPEREAFDENLELWGRSRRTDVHGGGLLLVRIDRFDHLRGRFGAFAADQFLQGMAVVLVHAVRDDDLVCRVAEDAFAVLFPDVDAEAGARLAQTVRCAVRQHRFRLGADGPEVLVTAGFGYAGRQPDESPLLALDRASRALEKSQRRGRNQLHIDDGAALQLVAG